MIDQALFDALADALVERGQPVSYTTVQAELRAFRNRGTSDRDLQIPLGDWIRRRRYKRHLAMADLPVEMEKAIVAFTMEAMRIAKGREVGLAKEDADVRTRIEDLERRLAEALSRNRELADRLDALAPAPPADPGAAEEPDPVEAAAPALRSRKKGATAATSRFFWDRVIRELAVMIRREGPKCLDELLAAIAPQDLELAAAAFRPIDAGSLEKALAERTKRGRYGLVLVDDRYSVAGRGRRSPRRSTSTKAAFPARGRSTRVR